MKRVETTSGESSAVFNDEVRNAFSHSDYIIAPETLRWTEGGLGGQMPLEHVSNLIANAFTFFGRFIGMRDRWLRLLAEMPRYHKWPGFEVLELLQDGEARLNGFKVHFSNGTSAKFQTSPEGVECTNIIIEQDGTINFMVGLLNARRPVWMVDGRVVDFGEDHSAREF